MTHLFQSTIKQASREVTILKAFITIRNLDSWRTFAQHGTIRTQTDARRWGAFHSAHTCENQPRWLAAFFATSFCQPVSFADSQTECVVLKKFWAQIQSALDL